MDTTTTHNPAPALPAQSSAQPFEPATIVLARLRAIERRIGTVQAIERSGEVSQATKAMARELLETLKCEARDIARSLCVGSDSPIMATMQGPQRFAQVERAA